MRHEKQDYPSESLGSALARDAARLTPPFSESLHTRAMAALGSAGSRQMPVERPQLAWRLFASPAVPWAVAAVVVLAVALWRFCMPTGPGSQTMVSATRTAPASKPAPARFAQVTPPVQPVLGTVTDDSGPASLFPKDLGSRQLAQLDHDAHFALRLVLSPLPGAGDASTEPDQTQPSR